MMNFNSKLKELKAKIDKELVKVFDNCEPEDLYKPMKYAVEIGGKRIRPILCEVFYRIFSKDNSGQTIYPALAIEFLHNFTLVHDDIMDNDDLRRNSPTVHCAWDLATGVLAGDGLISLAYNLLAKDKYQRFSEIMDVFSKGVIEVCEGQAYDKAFETSQDVNLEEYLLMIKKKTGALIKVPCMLGALCGNADPKDVELAGEFGELVGLSFQIQDDILDITADEEVLGKSYGSDVAEGKKTYLYVSAMKQMDEADKKRYLEILESKETTKAEVLEVKKLYEKYNIIEESIKAALSFINKAELILEDFTAEDVSFLKGMLEYLKNRKY